MGSGALSGMANAWAREQERRAPHLNFRWTMADMDQIKELAAKRYFPGDIAFEVGATSEEIVEVCARNNIMLRVR